MLAKGPRRRMRNGHDEAYGLVKGNCGSGFVAHKLKVIDSDDEGLDVDEEVEGSEAKEPESGFDSKDR